MKYLYDDDECWDTNTYYREGNDGFDYDDETYYSGRAAQGFGALSVLTAFFGG